jgi:hypothetical protein
MDEALISQPLYAEGEAACLRALRTSASCTNVSWMACGPG